MGLKDPAYCQCAEALSFPLHEPQGLTWSRRCLGSVPQPVLLRAAPLLPRGQLPCATAGGSLCRTVQEAGGKKQHFIVSSERAAGCLQCM